jgi:hypothetical protein
MLTQRWDAVDARIVFSGVFNGVWRDMIWEGWRLAVPVKELVRIRSARTECEAWLQPCPPRSKPAGPYHTAPMKGTLIMPWRVRQATPPSAKVPPARRNAVSGASAKTGGKTAAAEEEEEKVQVPTSSKPASCALHVSNFLRPFTQNQVRQSHVYCLRCVCASERPEDVDGRFRRLVAGAQQSRAASESRCIVALAFVCGRETDRSGPLLPTRAEFLLPLGQVLALLREHGTVLAEHGFWMNSIKTHCYVRFGSTDEAQACRDAIWGRVWPPQHGKKLTAEFVDDQQAAQIIQNGGPPAAAPAAPPVADAVAAAAAAAKKKKESPAARRREAEAVKTLDDLFRKTKVCRLRLISQ